jgi:Leucine-rich repeat (LRR) protein
MKQTLGVLFCLISFWGISQPDRTYRLSELENAVKDSVYSLDLRREKLYAIPAIVFELPNLRQLNLSKNKLEMLGDSITLLKKLNRLDLSHNKFKAIPYAIFRLENLTHLSLGMNQIERIPDEIAYLTQLESLDLYDNAITYFSPSLKMLATLKKLDIQGVMYGHVMHAKLVEDFKHCILLIDPPCSCMD